MIDSRSRGRQNRCESSTRRGGSGPYWRVAAIPQDARVPVDVGDVRRARGGVDEARVERHHTGGRQELGECDFGKLINIASPRFNIRNASHGPATGFRIQGAEETAYRHGASADVFTFGLPINEHESYLPQGLCRKYCELGRSPFGQTKSVAHW